MRMRWLCCLLWRFGSQIHWSKCLQGSTVFVSGAVVFLAPGVSQSQILGAPHSNVCSPFYAGVWQCQVCQPRTMLYWRIGTYSGFALHQVTIWRSLADLSKQWRMTITWGKTPWGTLILRPTYLISGISTCHFNAQQPPKLPIGELHLYPKHEILDVAMDTPSPQVLGFLPEVLGFGGFGGEICFKKWPIWNDDSDYFVIRIIFIFMYIFTIFIYQYIFHISSYIHSHDHDIHIFENNQPFACGCLCCSVLLSMVRTASPIEAGILRPGFYEAPGFGRDDAPLRLNILAFYFRPLGWREIPHKPSGMLCTGTVVKRLSNCQHRRSQGSWHEWDEKICHFDAFFMFIGNIGFVHICA